MAVDLEELYERVERHIISAETEEAYAILTVGEALVAVAIELQLTRAILERITGGIDGTFLQVDDGKP